MPETGGPTIAHMPSTSNSDVNVLYDEPMPIPTPHRLRETASLTSYRGYNVGDRVRLVKYYEGGVNQLADVEKYSEFYYGMVGVIHRITPRSDWCFEVHFDDKSDDGKSIRGALGTNEIEIAVGGDPAWEV
ncbi:MAG: hypothetical protein ACW99G_04860 [Candidatus Thorarchaeota archaeon]|jgi:hypothetical protein